MMEFIKYLSSKWISGDCPRLDSTFLEIFITLRRALYFLQVDFYRGNKYAFQSIEKLIIIFYTLRKMPVNRSHSMKMYKILFL